MQQRNSSAAESNRFRAADAEMIKQREHILCGLTERMLSFKARRCTVASHIRPDQPKTGWWVLENVLPILTAAGPAMKP